jgi:hypothetical protein
VEGCLAGYWVLVWVKKCRLLWKKIARTCRKYQREWRSACLSWLGCLGAYLPGCLRCTTDSLVGASGRPFVEPIATPSDPTGEALRPRLPNLTTAACFLAAELHRRHLRPVSCARYRPRSVESAAAWCCPSAEDYLQTKAASRKSLAHPVVPASSAMSWQPGPRSSQSILPRDQRPLTRRPRPRSLPAAYAYAYAHALTSPA